METKGKQRIYTPKTFPKPTPNLGKLAENLLVSLVNLEIDQQGAETVNQLRKTPDILHTSNTYADSTAHEESTPPADFNTNQQQETSDAAHASNIYTNTHTNPLTQGKSAPLADPNTNQKIPQKNHGLVFLHRKSRAHQLTRSQHQSRARNQRMKML